MKKILFLVLSGVAATITADCFAKSKESILPVTALATDQTKPITIFIHGSLPGWLRPLLSYLDLGIGLYKANDLKKSRWFLGKAGWWLFEGDPQQFPLENTYLYGWDGPLSFEVRDKAAEVLYFMLKDYKGPITIIGHSHGGTIGLLLAKIAAKYNDTTFKVDRLVTLGTPVLATSKPYLDSPTFNQIYFLYSRWDLMQNRDPQRLYATIRNLNDTQIPFFAERTFTKRAHAIQAEISTGRISPGHYDFGTASFLHRLGELLHLLEDVAQKARTQNGPSQVLVKVPSGNKPVYVEKAL